MKKNLKPNLVVYDIPVHVKFRNPSRQLWRVGVRINYSCWVIPEEFMPWSLLKDLKDAGGDWHSIRFDEQEAEKLLKLAQAMLQKELENTIKRARESLEQAERRLNLEQAEEKKYTLKQYQDRIKFVLKNADTMIKNLEQSHKVFGIRTGNRIQNAMDAVVAFKITADEKAEAYRKLTLQVAQIDLGLSQAAMKDDVPVGILGDKLLDQGIDPSNELSVFIEESDEWNEVGNVKDPEGFTPVFQNPGFYGADYTD